MKFSDIHLDLLRSIIHEAAEAQILPRFRGMKTADIGTKKSAIDVVTDADVLAEEKITKALKVNFPNALVFGEEAVSKNPAVKNGLAEAELAFIIDPVDGTLNFVKGLPLFGTILSVVSHGEVVAGIIHDPLNRTFLMASRGAGAHQVFEDGDDVRLQVASPTSIENMTGVMCLMFFPEPQRSVIGANAMKLQAFYGLNCSVFDYWMVATGGAHFTGNLCGQIWDHLAGTLIHREAGGYNAHFDGTPYNALGDGANVLSAPDKESWELIRREIFWVK